jgi:hypothetical protein
MAFLNFMDNNPLAMLIQNGSIGPDFTNNPLHLTGQVDPSLTADLPAGRPAAAPQQRKGLGFRNVLGIIGDSILQAHGRQPIYGPMHEKQQLQGALQNFLTDPDGAIQALMQVDAPTAISLYRMVHPANETPAAVREFQVRQKMSPQEQAAFDHYLQLTHPGMMAPITLGPNDTYEAPGMPQESGSAPVVNSAQEAIAKYPPGTVVQSPDGRHFQVPGGATGAPSRTFPQ